jgi:hypothetical protein
MFSSMSPDMNHDKSEEKLSLAKHVLNKAYATFAYEGPGSDIEPIW